MTTKLITKIGFVGLTLSLFSCQIQKPIEKAESVISEARMKEYVQVLASDEFQGRKPFSPGESKTIKYISEVYSDLGLKTDNNYLQEVPLVK